MALFGDLGVREELTSVLEDEGLEEPTTVQQALIPVLRRRGNVVARTSTGSGKTLAYLLGVLDALEVRDDDAEEPAVGRARVLILRPTREAAENTATRAFPFAQAMGLTVAVPGGSWGTPLSEAEVVVATPSDALDAVRTSSLKLDELNSFVMDGAAAMQRLGEWEPVDTLLDQAARGCQRVVITAQMTAEVEDLIDRRVKRALRYPAESAVPIAPAALDAGTLGYVVAPEAGKPDVLARLLAAAGADVTPLVFCRTDEDASQLAEWLTMRGFLVGNVDDPDVDVAVRGPSVETQNEDEPGTGEHVPTISFDVPADAAQLAARHSGETESLVLVAPRELPHLQATAREAGFALTTAGEPTSGSLLPNSIDAFRALLRQALQEEDIGAQMLVLEPLLDEFSALEVAAAAAALLRSRRPATPAAAPAASVVAGPPAAQAGARGPARADRGPQQATFTRLYVGVGSRDEVRPGDIVGAITGEANVPGSAVGKVDIRENFSVVEVQADVAEQVLRAVNGTTIKSRAVRVDYDRPTDRTPERGRRDGGERGPREGGTGGTRRPVRRSVPPRGFGE